MARGASLAIGKLTFVRVIHHAYPVVPQPHTYSALMTYIRYRFGFVLPTMLSQDEADAQADVMAGRVLGSYILLDIRRSSGKKKGAHS